MKLQRVYIILLLISIFLVLFAIQNADPVNFTFISFRFNISLSLLVILSIALGAILSFLLSLNEFIRLKNELKKSKKEVERIRKDYEDLHEAGSTVEF